MSAMREGGGGDSLVRDGSVDRDAHSGGSDLISDEVSEVVHGRCACMCSADASLCLCLVRQDLVNQTQANTSC